MPDKGVDLSWVFSGGPATWSQGSGESWRDGDAGSRRLRDQGLAEAKKINRNEKEPYTWALEIVVFW